MGKLGVSDYDPADKLPVFTMPSGVDFLGSLAAGLRAQYGEGLSDALILLPTRRAVRALGDAFVDLAREDGKGVTLLPRMRPLADIDPDEPPFEIGDLAARVPREISGMQRRFDMAKIVTAYHHKISSLPITPAGTLAMADQLLMILDDADMEEVDLSKTGALTDIAKMATEHYQNAAELFKIISDYWPKYLAEQNAIGPMARRVALLNALTELWSETPPDYPVIIAGSTGTLGATARLMGCVARLADSQIILPGLDVNLRTAAWDAIGAEHPQNALKNLLSVIGIDRADVRDFTPLIGLTGSLSGRRRVISEALVPVPETNDWPTQINIVRHEKEGYDPFEVAFKGLSLIEAETDDEEAMSIALIMRETLEAPDATAALVTPDPALARRVKAKLRRWDVNVDYSQGEPLEETQMGAYLAGLMRVIIDPENPVHLAFIAKHPLSAMGWDGGRLSQAWRRIERKALRGPRRSIKNIDAMRFDKNHYGRDIFDDDDRAAIDDLIAFDNVIKQTIDALSGPCHADVWARNLTTLAETLATTDDTPGMARLWLGEAGEKAALLLTQLIEHGGLLPAMDAGHFADVFGNLMRGQVVRPRYGTHPRLQILGPLEARMLWADTVVLGGLNEGIWPVAPTVEPFLSRSMRRALGLSLPERRYGLSAHDFAELASNPKVILTRSKRTDSGPAVASRWLWRLQTLARGAHMNADGMDMSRDMFKPDQDYLGWARAVDAVDAQAVSAIERPEPAPPLDARWPKGRQISVTRLTTLIRDPYAHYARTILGLEPLDNLDSGLDARVLGTSIHGVLEDFSKRFGDTVPDDAREILAGDLAASLSALNVPDATVYAERPRLERIAGKYLDWFSKSRADGWHTAGLEVSGKMSVSAKGGEFQATAIADRIDYRSGQYRLVDYKTGKPPSTNVIKAGFDAQLPLQVVMIDQDGFKDMHGTVGDMSYLSLQGFNDDPPFHSLQTGRSVWSPEDYAQAAEEALQKLIDYFDTDGSIYHAQPRIQYENIYGDYDHLSRRAEWAKAGDNDTNGGEG
ncbi:double-strand break repair protein AddB [Fretibacter rubidus]|uniref:double-strand break repair protein AddB n=1 Tax=Fretibacter rubidus TaxID=570162 RepID=UPI00352A9A2B